MLSDLAAGVTAEITYVDCGFSQVALGMLEAPPAA
jgi:enoyl-[acyl-carrier-protein] reductase (NADH)